MINPQERKRQEREARRHRIQDAARPVFFERGFARTSIEDIAKQAQLSVGAIYLYFKSKEDLYLSLLERSLGTLADTLSAARDPRDAWASLAAWRTAEPESARALGMVGRPELRGALSDEVADGLARSLGRIRAGLAGSVSQALQSGRYRGCDADAVGETLWSGFVGALAVDAMTTNVGGAALPAIFEIVDGGLRQTQPVRAAA